MQPTDEIDSRNEIFSKSGTEPMFRERKPLSNIQAHMTKNQSNPITATKSKNMHTKINRGISPNQPPQNKPTDSEVENQRVYHQPSSIVKQEVKESSDVARRSSSLKVKKDNDRITYNKPSPSSRGNIRGGGSFVVQSNASNKKSNSLPKKTTKDTNSTQNIKPSYSKNVPGGISSNPSATTNNGHYRLGSNYLMKNSSGSNFTANPRIRKAGAPNPSAQNTMASFRSGPVKVINDNNNNAANNNTKKDVTKRPSSASKALKKNPKLSNKASSRPGTASTRTNSNRPPSPGSRSLKSDLLFGSYNRNKSSKIGGATKKLGVTKQSSSSTGKIKSSTSAVIPKTRTKPQSPGRSVLSKPVTANQNKTYTNYKGLLAPSADPVTGPNDQNASKLF